ncbi:MAG: putative spermidine/putrescine transport system ATP-binding protein [Alphaproteobacteria bacterium]|jgi:spermidine/putrescine ABC transporter ATP-binding subunit|nr:putative spermidine/putrescine transport system ATP-binding protein [Alphaproteobacteria bacterium]
MQSANLVLDQIYKTYASGVGLPAVSGITLNVKRGEFLTLLGPSGCGKTTLLRIAGGFIAPSSGRVLVEDKDVTKLPPQQRPTAMVFQNYALFPHMTAADNVAFGLKVRRLPGPEIAERVKAALTIVSLAEFGDRYPHQMSGGQQQRVALARALAVEPPVLLMDEPLGALDAKLREEMQFELCSIQQRLGITTIYVTHDQEEAFNMSDRVAVMHQGRILQLDAPEEIYRKPTSAFVANFVGRSNTFRGTVCEGGREIKITDGHTLTVNVPADLKPQAGVVLIVRPEDIAVGECAGADNRVEGTVERRRFTGGAYLYHVRIGPHSLIVAEDRRATLIAVGEKVRLCWRSHRSILLPENSPGISP